MMLMCQHPRRGLRMGWCGPFPYNFSLNYGGIPAAILKLPVPIGASLYPDQQTDYPTKLNRILSAHRSSPSPTRQQSPYVPPPPPSLRVTPLRPGAPPAAISPGDASPAAVPPGDAAPAVAPPRGSSPLDSAHEHTEHLSVACAWSVMVPN